MILLFDAGATKTRLAISENGKSFNEPVVFHTEKNFSEQIKKIKRIAEKELSGKKIDAIAGGISGPLNTSKMKLTSSPNLPLWVGVNIKEELEEAFSAPVFLENDSALVGLGETLKGAGKGYKIVAYITVSTGVGGVRIVNGRIDVKDVGFEPGHHIIDFKGDKCNTCKGIGHLEEYISGQAIEKRYGKKPYEIHDSTVWDQEARLLAIGLHNVCVFWSPECVVLGGSMIVGDPAIPIKRVEHYLKKLLTIFPKIPIIKKATLGDFGGLYGALIYLRQNP